MKENFARLPLSLAVSLLLPALAHAQDAILDRVIVTAPTAPGFASAATVDGEALPALRAATSDTASLLRAIPGVSVYGAGGVSSQPVVRGLGDDRLRVKVDGMDLISACGNHMNPPLSYIDPSNVADVQVFAGISPVSLGGDSLGGAVVVDSPDPGFAAAGEAPLRKGELGAFYRSNGDARGVNAAATVAGENLSVRYRGSVAEANNYRAGDGFKPAGAAAAGRGWLAGDEVGGSGYESTNQSLAVALRHANHLLELKAGVQDIPYQGWPNQRMDMTGNDSEQLNLRYKGAFDWGALDARAYQERTRHKMQFGEDKLYWYGPTPAADGVPCAPAGGMSGCAAGMPMDTRGENEGLSLKADLALSAHDLLRIGSEFQNYRLDDWWDPSGKGMWPETFRNINNGERDRYAVFGEWEAAWNPHWTTLFGLRHETVKMNAGRVQWYNPAAAAFQADAEAFNAAERSRTDHNVDIVALARFTPDASRSIEFGYAQKTRSPNLYERYAWSTNGMAMRMVNMAGDGNGYVGSLELEPETAHTLSASFDWHDAAGKGWSIRLAPHFTYVDGYIDAERIAEAGAEEFVYLRFVNQSARLHGVDLSGHALLARQEGIGSFTARGSLSYVRGKNRTTGDNLYNIMPLNAKLALEHRFGGWTNTVEGEFVSAKNKVSAERNELATAGYGLLHLRSSYVWKQVRVDVGVENVFDRYYADPLGGAYTGSGKTMSATGVPWGVAVPGMGRSIYAGVNIGF